MLGMYLNTNQQVFSLAEVHVFGHLCTSYNNNQHKNKMFHIH